MLREKTHFHTFCMEMGNRCDTLGTNKHWIVGIAIVIPVEANKSECAITDCLLNNLKKM